MLRLDPPHSGKEQRLNTSITGDGQKPFRHAGGAEFYTAIRITGKSFTKLYHIAFHADVISEMPLHFPACSMAVDTVFNREQRAPLGVESVQGNAGSAPCFKTLHSFFCNFKHNISTRLTLRIIIVIR